MTFFDTSTRMNGGAPMSEGSSRVHAAPETHSMASTGAQINSFDPSKSALQAGSRAAKAAKVTSQRFIDASLT
jgi:hypothetical protein